MKYNRNQQGFSLLEVLVSLVILSIGLLGLAGIQGVSLKNNTSASHRTQATLASYDVMDRMRSNSIQINQYLSSNTLPTAATNIVGCSASSGCSATQMAEDDLFEWNQILTSTLPSGTGSVTASGSVYTITVNWDDNRDGNVDDDDPNFSVSFRP